MSKQTSRKPSPSTVRPASPRISDLRRHSPRAGVPASRNRKSPSLFEPSSSFTERVGFNGSLGQQQYVKPRAVGSFGVLDDHDLLSQSAGFDEADSEIQSIYEERVKDSSMKNSLHEIITAQKLHALSHTQMPPSSSPSSSQGGHCVGLGQTYYTHRGMYTPSSSTSHFVAPSLPHFQQTSFSSRGKDSTQGQGSGEKVTHTQGQPGHGSLTDTSRSSLEEDQRSDNTVPAGYMVVDAVQEAVAPNFHDFELPLPETMSDDALMAMLEFVNKEMLKRNNPSSKDISLSQLSLGVVKATERRKSSPAVAPQGAGKGLVAGANRQQTATPGQSQGQGQGHSVQTPSQRRPRSKSGGSEGALTGREEGQVSSRHYEDLDCNNSMSRSSYSCEDDCVSSESGRARPVEKMLGLTPGYLKKPSPSNCPGHTQSQSQTRSKDRASPWLVFDPPHHQHRQSSPPGTASSPSRTLSSSSPICIGSNGLAQAGCIGGGGGPIRLPAKKVTSVPMTLFSPEEHGEKRRKEDCFSRSRHDEDDSHSFVSITSSLGSGRDREYRPMPYHHLHYHQQQQQQHLQSLIISPRTAFDDISVSSSEGSSRGKKGGYGGSYRKPPVPISGVVGVSAMAGTSASKKR